MNEMLYGNTGKRDEGVNIDMDVALYQKLQSRAFVPKLKSMLNDRLQPTDKSFVFIGEVVEKTGKFSVYGYNAKLENDSRGGDYGHYVAVPLGAVPTIDISSVDFLTEEGFVEYVNYKTLNADKRFTMQPQQIEINENAKKRIVNNLMETFMRVRKRKNVVFSFEESDIENFSAKSIFVLCDIVKYLPYCMRKNIAFISHVASSQKLPDMVNLVAYPSASEFKPHDCIDIEAEGGFDGEGVFAKYVEGVFALSDVEREAYLEKIHTDIEIPAFEKGIDVKSDLYLLDTDTKDFWLNGNIVDVIDSIFKSVLDVLLIYPRFNELAKERLTNSFEELIVYIQRQIVQTQNTGELSNVYNSVKAVFDALQLNMDDSIVGLFKARTTDLVEKANEDEKLIKVVEAVLEINAEFLDKEVLRERIETNMKEKHSISLLHQSYLRIKDKQYIDTDVLDNCLGECVEEIYSIEIGKCATESEKLSRIERMSADISNKGCSIIQGIHDRYYMKYKESAREEVINNSRNKLYNIERDLREVYSLLDLKSCVNELAEVNVSLDESLKKLACDIYKRISTNLFAKLAQGEGPGKQKLKIGDFKQLIVELESAVEQLNSNEIYDAPLRNGWGQEKYAPDGLYRLVFIFVNLINSMEQVETLDQAFMTIENIVELIDSDERKLEEILNVYTVRVFYNWLNKNQKFATDKAYKKAEKLIRKKHDKQLSNNTKKCFENAAIAIREKNQEKREKKLAVLKIAVLILSVLLVGGGIVFGGIKLLGFIRGDSLETSTEITTENIMEINAENATETDSKPTESDTSTESELENK